MAAMTHTNGLMSPPATEKASSIASPPRVVLAGKTGRVLCVADIRGDYHELNRLIREHDATAVIHTGDFGFIDSSSLDRMGDKILRHLLQYSPLIAPGTRTQLLGIPPSAGRANLLTALNNSSIHFPLSQFPHLLSGAITFPVPVFTVWGLIEDVRVLEKFRTGEYEVHNLSVIDEACSKVLDVGGLKLRLFGLGGAVAHHKMFDNGEGHATIAGGSGTMWTTALQIGELVDTAQRVFDPSETRLFITSAPVSRNGLLSQLSNALRADLTISGGLHFRYPASYNEFAVHADFDAYREKLEQAKATFTSVYNSVKEKVDSSLSEQQQALLKKAVGVSQTIPTEDDKMWTNTWHWVLSDASCGHMLLSISEGRVSAETKSSGLNFAHRAAQAPAPPSAPVTPAVTIVQPTRRTSGPPNTVPSATVAPSKPPTAPMGRPGAPATNASGIPPKPPQMGQGVMNNFARGPLARPAPPTAPVKLTGPSTPGDKEDAVKPAASVQARVPLPPSGPAKAPIPPRPAAQSQPTRQPRGPGASIANQALAAAGIGKDTKSDPAKPSESARPVASSPAPPNKPISKPATPAGTQNKDAKPAPPPPTATAEKAKPVEEKKVEGEKINGDKGADKGPEEQKDGGGEHSREASGEGKPGVPRERKWSLYVKGLPVPIAEDSLKSAFGDAASKVTSVKIIYDHFNKKQKDFAYLDFATEEDMQAALKDRAEVTIGENKVSCSVSNPPSRAFPDFGRGRGRGSFRGRGGGRGTFGGGVRREGSEGAAAATPSAGGEGKKE